MRNRRLGLTILAVLAIGAGSLLDASAGLIPTQLNDDAFDAGKGDGTHDTQLNPSSSFWGPKVGFGGFDRFSGAPQQVGTSYTMNGGSTWFDNGNIAGGSNLMQGRIDAGWNPETQEYVVASENTFTGSGQRPIAVTRSDSWGVNWSGATDTYTSIGFGSVARYPSLAINEEPTSTNYGNLGLTWTLTGTSLGKGDLYYQSSAQGTSWSSPVKVNESDCTGVGGASDLTLAGDSLYVAFACSDGLVSKPKVMRSTNGGVSWGPVISGLPSTLPLSGEAASCGNGSLVERTVFGDLGVFDDPRLAFDPTGNMLFLTTTSHGAGSDLSDIHIFGAPNTTNPTWVPYEGLPGDEGSTYIAPEIGINYVDGTRNLWYSGGMIPSSGTQYRLDTWVTTDLAEWNLHSFNPSYTLPVLKPNEDTAIPDCYFGHNIADLDDLGGRIGLTYVGTPDGSRRPAGGTDVDPDILFAALDPPADLTPTSMTLNVKKTDAKIKASGKITPPVPGGEAEVTLFKKKDGVFKVVGSPKTAAFDDAGAYKASFNRPARGKCRITGDWNGDGDFAASSVSKTFDCKN